MNFWTSYNFALEGNFKFQKRFPFIYVSEKFLDTLILLKPTIAVDPYFADMLSKEARDRAGLQLTTTDKIGKGLGYFLYGIMYTMIAIIGLAILIGFGAWVYHTLFGTLR